MSNQAKKSAVRARMEQTGENYTTARRHLAQEAVPRPERRSGQTDTDAIRAMVSRTWHRYSDGTGRLALVTDTIPTLCDEVDSLRGMERGLIALAADETVSVEVRARLRNLLDTEPVETTVDLTLPAPDSTSALRVPRRSVPFPGGSSQGDFFRAAAERVAARQRMGSNLTRTVVTVLDDYAAACDRADGTAAPARPTRANREIASPDERRYGADAEDSGGRWGEYLCRTPEDREAVLDRLAPGRTMMDWGGALWQVLWGDGDPTEGAEWWTRITDDDGEIGWLSADPTAYPRTYWVWGASTA